MHRTCVVGDLALESARALMLTLCLPVSLRLQYWARWTCVVFYVICKAVVYALFVEKAFLANKFMYKVRRWFVVVASPAPRTIAF